ncbi:MAG TPA: universal stress protein [Thermoleophilaceae bacterium]|nr:universal stress protein [Thermoleophilaceae bacterium]
MTGHAMDYPPVSGGAYGEPEAGPVIVVGYDGSPNARAALAYAARRAGPSGLVIVVYAHAPGPSWFGAPSYQPPRSGDPEIAHSVVRTAEVELPPRIPHETMTRSGSPPTVLQEIATERDADEIVVGAHGSDPERRGLGNVTRALLEDADRPVVVMTTRAASRS